MSQSVVQQYTVTALEVAETGLSPILIAARKGLNIEHPFMVEVDDGSVHLVFSQREVRES